MGTLGLLGSADTLELKLEARDKCGRARGVSPRSESSGRVLVQACVGSVGVPEAEAVATLHALPRAIEGRPPEVVDAAQRLGERLDECVHDVGGSPVRFVFSDSYVQ